MEVEVEPAFLSEPEKVREERAEWRDRILQAEEDFEARAPVGDGDDWTGDHE